MRKIPPSAIGHPTSILQQIPPFNHSLLYPGILHIKGIDTSYQRHIKGISKAYQRHVSSCEFIWAYMRRSIVEPLPANKNLLIQ